MPNVLVVAEAQHGVLRSASLNAVSLGRALVTASSGGTLTALLVGKDLAAAAAELARYPVDQVLTVDHPALASYLAESYAPVVAAVAKQLGAEHVAATATSTGKDLLPRVAALLEAGMASEVSAVVSPRRFKRPMLAGNAIGLVEVSTSCVVVTGRQTEWPAAQPAAAPAPIAAAPVQPGSTLGAEVVGIAELARERPELTEARVVVTGGRGLGSGENFKHIEALADVLGGAVGATRAACDAGMVPNDLQVGQTGKVVAPELYIAIGVSGAIQHLAGMKSSRVIVAINKNPEAPIFQVADYGLVAKWEDTVDALTAKLRALGPA
ncbi:MAG: electron transfer flavoprotein subunit alpha/FixB family protein [Proteobacteria bacterium]|nr:electron transfer flavoprotein subunit alpha/FixB family protein [Pseudomonadota bacterium]